MKTPKASVVMFIAALCVGVWGMAQAATLAGVTQMTAGSNHNCALGGNGGVYCWGNNAYQQLGGKRSDMVFVATKVDMPSDVIQVSTGDSHTCALHKDGSVSCWGYNRDGQAGDGSQGEVSPRVIVKGLSDITAISAGRYHTCALSRSGSVSCWGENEHGQVGEPGDKAVPAPVVVALQNVTAIGAGGYHTCALSSGKVYCWGNNRQSQLGAGTRGASRKPVEILGVSDARKLVVGTFHNCVINDKGQASCWGSNRHGQLGDGSNADSREARSVISPVDNTITALAAGTYHTCATNGARTHCWGSNRYGQIGNEIKNDINSTPLAVGGLAPLKELVAGSYHTCAITHDNSVQCWGANRSGQMGAGTRGESSSVSMVRD